jgi:hypothetical protein
MPKVNAAIFILTQNNEVRRTYLKTCLYFLFRHFNATHKYPVVIHHEGDYDANAQREIIMSVRQSCRHLVTFVALEPGDFQVPEFIDTDKMEKCIAVQPVPYWRSAKYRLMCRWWLTHFLKYAKGYDYVMRVDDDSIIEEPIEQDLFAWMESQNITYSSNLVHVDCGICNFGMKELLESLFPEKKPTIAGMFQKSTLPVNNAQFFKFRSLLSIMYGDTYKLGQELDIWMPIMYYNNFFITKTSFWLREDVQKTIQAVDEHGGIFYYRWGDAPLQSLIAMLYCQPHEIKRAIFKYSKRLQREVFVDDNGTFHSYMPATYDKSSSITDEE